MTTMCRLVLAHGLSLVLAATGASGAEQADRHEVVIYGGTSGGVAAAIQTARMGHSVVLIEPSRHLGGLSSGGLGYTDIGSKEATGGIAREFYQRIHRYYSRKDVWMFDTLKEYREREKGAVNADTMWCFEPRVAEATFRQMLAEIGVTAVYGERLDLKHGVRKEGTRIITIIMESGRVFPGRIFIDATYEGDLMAKAGVNYTVGREANSQYGETLNGVQPRQTRFHQFEKPIDPYVKPGNPQSGLLPGIHPGGPGEEGAGDQRVQAYNFRMCLTDVPENRVPFAKPASYDPVRYEILLRHVEAGCTTLLWTRAMPNRKTDTNNYSAFSTDNIGMNYEYPDGDYTTREKIIADHRDYQLGLMWTLANHPRVPAQLRVEFSRWGLAKDEFIDSGNWPHQLYVREARRMVSDYIMTERNCRGERVAEDSVGLGSFVMDSHNVQRYVDAQGHARNEGDVQVSGFPPYPISYRSITPRATDCTNLLVPVCLSTSHIAYGSLRMEPVFMILGQSAATAGVHAIAEECPVQEIDYSSLQARLRQDGQVVDKPVRPAPSSQ